jgi:hypothetical protein
VWILRFHFPLFQRGPYDDDYTRSILSSVLLLPP